jgi:hypothetical protein
MVVMVAGSSGLGLPQGPWGRMVPHCPPKAKAARSNRAGRTKITFKIKELMGIVNVRIILESHGLESHGNSAKAAFILMGRLLNLCRQEPGPNTDH